MSQGSESQLIREFREVLARDELAEDVTVVYGVSGGIPGQRVGDREAFGGEVTDLKLAGDGNLTAPGAPAVQLDPAETRQLLELVASSLDSMVPEGEARFVPDSVIGSVTIGVGGNEATLYFLADESQRFGQSERIARSAMEGTRLLREMLRWARDQEGPTP
jgi:hypothetical protein